MIPKTCQGYVGQMQRLIKFHTVAALKADSEVLQKFTPPAAAAYKKHVKSVLEHLVFYLSTCH